jgi:hypothetical protein
MAGPRETTPSEGARTPATPRDTVESDSSSPSAYTVSFSAPWIVRGVETTQDAINIAVAEVGKRVRRTDSSIQRVDITVQHLGCHRCETTTDAVLSIAETALVGLVLTADVTATDPDTAETTALRALGPHLPETPLARIDVTRAASSSHE